MSKIRVENLTKCFGDFVANDHINLQVEAQEIRCIVGENGAGKSTLMNMLYGLLRPTSGQIYIDENPVAFASPSDAIAYGIGMVHQHFKLVPSLTVYENVLLGAELMRGVLIDTHKEIETITQLIAQYSFDLDPLARVEDISVGARQRVEILKMLYRNVDVLILDEPTAVLTPQEVDELLVHLKALRDHGKTIIMITHKLREVMEVSDSISIIRRGQLIASCKTCETSQAELAELMVGRKISQAQNSYLPIDAFHEVLCVTDLSTTNALGKQVLKDISLSVHSGEIVGIAGVEGNGQSELVKVLTGMMRSTAGSVKIAGTVCTNAWPDELRNHGVGIIPEDRFAQGLCATMSIAENCIAGYHNRPEVCHHGLLSKHAMLALRDTLIEDFDIRVGDVNGVVGSLSGGNAQKVIVARELAQHPQLIIACQPTRGVDIGSATYIHKQLLAARNAGQAVLLISSELSEVMSLSDRIVVMYKGELIGTCDPKTATSAEIGLLMAGITQEVPRAI